MELEIIIFSKMTQKQKVKNHMFSPISRGLTMGTQGHVERDNRHWRLQKLGGWSRER